MRSWSASVVLVIKRALSEPETMQEYLVTHGAATPATYRVFAKGMALKAPGWRSSEGCCDLGLCEACGCSSSSRVDREF
jgi:hypothetical protein